MPCISRLLGCKYIAPCIWKPRRPRGRRLQISHSPEIKAVIDAETQPVVERLDTRGRHMETEARLTVVDC